MSLVYGRTLGFTFANAVEAISMNSKQPSKIQLVGPWLY